MRKNRIWVLIAVVNFFPLSAFAQTKEEGSRLFIKLDRIFTADATITADDLYRASQLGNFTLRAETSKCIVSDTFTKVVATVEPTRLEIECDASATMQNIKKTVSLQPHLLWFTNETEFKPENLPNGLIVGNMPLGVKSAFIPSKEVLETAYKQKLQLRYWELKIDELSPELLDSLIKFSKESSSKLNLTVVFRKPLTQASIARLEYLSKKIMLVFAPVEPNAFDDETMKILRREENLGRKVGVVISSPLVGNPAQKFAGFKRLTVIVRAEGGKGIFPHVIEFLDYIGTKDVFKREETKPTAPNFQRHTQPAEQKENIEQPESK